MVPAEMLSLLLAALGAMFEIAGVLVMARRYINIGFWEGIAALFGSLVNSKRSEDALDAESLTVENARQSLQGLALISIGFILTFVSILITIANQSILCP